MSEPISHRTGVACAVIGAPIMAMALLYVLATSADSLVREKATAEWCLKHAATQYDVQKCR